MTKGLQYRKNPKNGFVQVRLHYSASKDRDEKWFKQASRGMSKDKWEQEQEINFTRAGGKPMYPDFKHEIHVKPLQVSIHYPLLVGLDFGYHHPAAVFCQKNHMDQLIILDEFMPKDVTVYDFAKHTLWLIKKNFPWHFERRSRFIEYYGDPAGTQVNDKSEHTTIQILRDKYRMFVRYKRIGKKQGIRVIQNKMLRRSDRSPGLLIDPKCKILIEGFSGGYQETPAQGTDQPKEMPHDDNYYSHTQDALRYLAINKFQEYGIYRPNKNPEISQWDPFEEEEVVDALTKQEQITGYSP